MHAIHVARTPAFADIWKRHGRDQSTTYAQQKEYARTLNEVTRFLYMGGILVSVHTRERRAGARVYRPHLVYDIHAYPAFGQERERVVREEIIIFLKYSLLGLSTKEALLRGR